MQSKAKLKFKSCFACRISECFNATMILAVTAIQLDPLDSCSNGAFGDGFADRCGRVTITAKLYGVSQGLVLRACTRQRFAVDIIDQLAAEMAQRTIHAQTRVIRRTTQLVTDVKPTSLAIFVLLLVLIHNSFPAKAPAIGPG
ncbi:hypothetical protein [Rosistilla carotiformis]